ncbi:unnamed protein product [marine sediment metagenome]|uniref:Aminotransferase class I/classII large domain-containing protein n=1 Tax=marine sediment metagenome TaxID=412755 RepID=X1PV56_9ZZZZ
MKIFLNIRSVGLKKSAIRAMFDKAKQIPGSINLGIGEPDLNTPAELIEEGCKALRSGKTRYTANAGIIELRTEIAKHLNRYDLSVNPESEIIVTVGGMGALALCLLVTITPGDEVLLQDPQWLNYFSQIKFCGGIPISVPVYGLLLHSFPVSLYSSIHIVSLGFALQIQPLHLLVSCTCTLDTILCDIYIDRLYEIIFSI